MKFNTQENKVKVNPVPENPKILINEGKIETKPKEEEKKK